MQSQGKAWAGLLGGIINPVNRLTQSVTKELSDLELSQKSRVGKALVRTGGMINPLGGPITGAAATLISLGNKKKSY